MKIAHFPPVWHTILFSRFQLKKAYPYACHDTCKMIIFNQFMEKMLKKKNLIKTNFDKNNLHEKCLEKNEKFSHNECGYFNEVGRKKFFIFFVLDMKLVSNFFFIKEFILSISKESITALISRRFRPFLPEKFTKKSENWCLFLVVYNILK